MCVFKFKKLGLQCIETAGEKISIEKELNSAQLTL